MRARNYKVMGLLASLLLALVLAACGGDDDDDGEAGSEQQLDDVTLQLGWIEKEEYAFLYSGIENGFFEEEGIDLNIQTGNGSSVAMTTVAETGAQFGYTGGPPFFVARSEGLPLKMVALFLQESPVTVLSWPDAAVEEIGDVQGKRFILTPGDGFTDLWPACAQRNDVSRGEVEELSIGTEARGQAFAANRADAIPWFLTTSISELEQQADTEFVELPSDEFDCSVVSNGLFTTDDLIKEDSDLVERMVAATTRSWEWTEENTEEAAEIILERLPGYELEDVTGVVESTMELGHTEASEGRPAGWSAESDWEDSLRLMEESGQLKGKVTVDDLVTNEFIPDTGSGGDGSDGDQGNEE